MALVAALLAATVAVGALLVASAWTPGQASRLPRRVPREPLIAVAGGAVAGVVALAITGWLAAALAVAIGGFAATRAVRRRTPGGASEQERIEALAIWCEQLRDLLAADQGIVGTISATVRTCPEALRPEVAALSARLGRQDAATAIGQYADEVDDPSADLVATVLLEATRRSSRTSELLSELAATIRERAAMRLRVEAERAGQRSEARFVVVFSALAIGAVCILGRDSEFLDAFDDGAGQLVLAIVALCFGGGVWWLGRLTRFERPARFLSVGVAGRRSDGGEP
jgi:Flp pilus assembly protein TadB